MINNPKVSIIVGCYNVAKWLRKGHLNDIYNQTYKHWELILVDDGSTDETLELLELEAKNDSRIRVIHKENGGLGSARNAGLDVASGDYIWSFDVDDHVDGDCLEYCVSEAEKRSADVVMFGFYAITPSIGTKDTIRLEETSINCYEELRDAYLDRILFVPNGNGFFWNKFYRRSFIEKYNLRFANQRIQQDEYFNLKVYEHLEHCYISPKVFYHYYIYNVGNNRSRFIPNRFEIYKSIYRQFRKLQVQWNINDERFEDYLQHRLYMNVGECLLFNLNHPKCTWTQSEKQEEINRIMEDKDVIDVLAHAESKGLNFEQRLYLSAYRSRSLMRIRLIKCFFECLRSAKKIIRKWG